MADSPKITREIARGVGDRLGIDWNAVAPAEFRRGREGEAEQATVDPAPPAASPEPPADVPANP